MHVYQPDNAYSVGRAAALTRRTVWDRWIVVDEMDSRKKGTYWDKMHGQLGIIWAVGDNMDSGE
jgi:hypothetical protein